MCGRCCFRCAGLRRPAAQDAGAGGAADRSAHRYRSSARTTRSRERWKVFCFGCSSSCAADIHVNDDVQAGEQAVSPRRIWSCFVLAPVKRAGKTERPAPVPITLDICFIIRTAKASLPSKAVPPSKLCNQRPLDTLVRSSTQVFTCEPCSDICCAWRVRVRQLDCLLPLCRPTARASIEYAAFERRLL